MVTKRAGKLAFASFVCLLFSVQVISGCASAGPILSTDADNVEKPAQLVSIDLETLREMIGQKQSFFLQISRDVCITCRDVEKAETELFGTDDSPVIYELDLSRDNPDYRQAREYLQELFPDFTVCPVFLWSKTEKKASGSTTLPIRCFSNSVCSASFHKALSHQNVMRQSLCFLRRQTGN